MGKIWFWYASRALALYYTLQCVVAWIVAWQEQNLHHRPLRLVTFAFLAVMCFLVFARHSIRVTETLICMRPFHLKRGEMMEDEMQKKFGDTTGNRGTQPDSGSEGEVSRVSQPNEQQPDEAAVLKDKYVRLFADLENTKKRLARSSAQEVEAEKEALLRDVLPVADGLDLALMHTQQEDDNRSILEGIELVRNILNKFFIKYDVKAIDAWGKPFDPRLHEAIGVVRHPKFPPNTVVRVEQKGYLYRDKLLRPAQVLVTPS